MLAQDLKALSFVLLTHQHADHLDLDLIRELKHLPIIWVIPESILDVDTKIKLTLPQKI